MEAGLTTVPFSYDCTQRQTWVVHNDRTLLEDSMHAIEGTSCNLLSRKEYLFDHVFGPESHNTTVYDKLVLPVVTRFVGGFNGTVSMRLIPLILHSDGQPVFLTPWGARVAGVRLRTDVVRQDTYPHWHSSGSGNSARRHP